MNIIRCNVGDKVKLEDGRIGTITYVQWYLGYLNGYEVKINEKKEMIFADEVEQMLLRIDKGGGCLPFKFSELKYEKWCITTDEVFDGEIAYLAWQKPAWDEDGYFWTSKDIVEKIICNSTSEHPFLFNSRKAVIKHLKTLNIPQRCMVVLI